MKPAPFSYHRADTLDEAAEMLAQTGGKVLAGGQSLVPIMSMRLASPTALVDINHLAGQGDVVVDELGVTIGCLVRHAHLEHDDAAFGRNPLLRRALTAVAHPTIRNRGTTVGSLVHADPAAEMPAVLALLGGSVEVLSSARGRRRIAAADLFVGPLESALQPDEVAVSATFLHPPAGSGSAWLELARRHGDFAMAGVGAVVSRPTGNAPGSAKVALIGVGMTPVVVDVSAATGGPGGWAVAADLVDAVIEPDGDIHASAAYRAQLARTLTMRALAAADAEAATGEAA